MSIPRLVILVSLLLTCVAPIAAQTSSAKPTHLDGLIAPTDAQISSPPEVERERERDAAGQSLSTLSFRSKFGEEDATCLYIRSYRVRRDDGQSDATRLTGYSTCTPSSHFQTKRAVQFWR